MMTRCGALVSPSTAQPHAGPVTRRSRVGSGSRIRNASGSVNSYSTCSTSVIHERSGCMSRIPSARVNPHIKMGSAKACCHAGQSNSSVSQR
jgi:hypothetical protein